MKVWIIPALIVFSLFGLVFVQYQLLKTGILFEKQQVDQKIESSFLEVEQKIKKDTILQAQILELLKENKRSVKIGAREKIEDFVLQSLEKRGVYFDFELALTVHYYDELLFSTVGFDPEMAAIFVYKKTLKGGLARACNCSMQLWIQADSLFIYILKKLSRIVIFSLIFSLLLLAGLIYFLHSLKKFYRLDKIKNRFINNLTHELKNPVFSISVLTKLIKKTLDTADKKQIENHLTLVEKETDSLKIHIDKVLELASMENGQYDYKRKWIDFHELVSNWLEKAQVVVENKGGKISLNLLASKPYVLGDPLHLENVLQNLLDNALKYNEMVPEIQLQTNTKQSKLLLTFQDNGIGLSKRSQKKIFHKFFRAEVDKPVKGFGLGLSYVREILKAHKGKITVSSKSGKGTTFLIELPAGTPQNTTKP